MTAGTQLTRPEVPYHADEATLAEWKNELHQLDPSSPEYLETASVLGELAGGNSLALGEATNLANPIVEQIPAGFSFRRELDRPAVLSGEEFAGKVRLLGGRDHEVGVTEFTTDRGAKVRLCDLRPEVSRSLKGIVPGTAKEQEKLDTAMLRDLKNFAETKQAYNTVSGMTGVNYTKVGSSKLRAYWMVAHDKNSQDGVPTVVRIGDCSRPGNQMALYRKLFGRNM